MAAHALWWTGTWRGQALLGGLIAFAYLAAGSAWGLGPFVYAAITSALAPLVSAVALAGVAAAVWSTLETPARLRCAVLAVLPALVLIERVQGNVHLARLIAPGQ